MGKLVAIMVACVVWAGFATRCWAEDGGPDYGAVSSVEQQSVVLPTMVQVLPDVWIPEVDLPAWEALVRWVAAQNGAVDVQGELVPWSPHRDLIVYTLKPCETGSMPWHERGGSSFLGPLQYTHATWLSLDPPTWWPWEASIADQVAVTERLVTRAGGTFRDFPGCRSRWGLP